MRYEPDKHGWSIDRRDINDQTKCRPDDLNEIYTWQHSDLMDDQMTKQSAVAT